MVRVGEGIDNEDEDADNDENSVVEDLEGGYAQTEFLDVKSNGVLSTSTTSAWTNFNLFCSELSQVENI